MAAIASAQAGPWATGATWTGGTAPGDGDTATIGHAVTVGSDVTVGHSPGAGDATKAVTVSTGATLTVQTGFTLVVRGDTLLSASDTVRSLIIEAGAVFEFDASAAAVPATALYTLTCPSQYPGSQPCLFVSGTSSSHAIIRSNAGGANGRIIGSGANYYGLLDAQYCDFLRIGDATNDAINSIVSSDGTDALASLYRLSHCTFNACGHLDFNLSNFGPHVKFKIEYCRFYNSVGAYNIYQLSCYNQKIGAQSYRIIDHNSFDKHCLLYAPRNLTVTNNYFGESFTNSATDSWQGMDSCSGNFFRFNDTYHSLTPNCNQIDNNYLFMASTSATNAHYLWVAGWAANKVQSATYNIFEGANSDGVGDCILCYSPSTPTNVAMNYNIMLPNAANENSGTGFSELGNSNLSITSVAHNTIFTGSQGCAVGETYGGHLNLLRSYMSNILWDSTASRGHKLYDSGTDNAVTNLVYAAQADYNCGYNLNTAHGLRSYGNKTGGTDLEISPTTPWFGVHDIDTNPKFVDSTRDLASWDASVGGAGTASSAMTGLAAGTAGYTIAALIEWIRTGFRPQEVLLRNAGKDGVTIGAVEYYGVGGSTTVPYATEFWTMLTEWWAYRDAYNQAVVVTDPEDTEDAGVQALQVANYYDATLCTYKMLDYASDSTTYQPMANRCATYYQDYWVNSLATPGQVSGYTHFMEGVVEHYQRTGSATALTAINNLLTNALYLNSGDVSDDLLSRECAYAILAFIHAGRVVTLDGTQTTRRDALKDLAIGHIDQWCTSLTADYCRPFMVGITCHALIEYYNRIDQDADIIAAIKTAMDYIIANCWDEGPTTRTDGYTMKKSFRYTDRNVGSTDPYDLEPQPDLNMIIAPALGFLYKHEQGTIYKTYGDKCVEGALPVYSGATFVSGAYFGTRSAVSPAGKQMDQQLVYGLKEYQYFVQSGGTAMSATPKHRMLLGIG